jgi:hypothetical protein
VTDETFVTRNTHTTVWSAWGEQELELLFPANWRVSDYSLPIVPALSASEIDARVSASFAPFAQKLNTAKTACILADDITRPACWTVVLNSVIGQLNRHGIADTNITILIALAGHGAMTPGELAAKLGAEVMARVHVAQHSNECHFIFFDHEGQRVGLNATYANADFKIALGSLIPHPFAGFSGGGKAVMPGVTDFESIRRNHYLVNFGRGKVFDPKNAIRRQMDGIAQLSGLDLLINVVCGAKREIVALFAGLMEPTFASGVQYAQRYSEMIIREPHEIIVLNAYPKDQELVQISNAINVLKTLPAEIASTYKAVVLIARLTKGMGIHAIFGPGGKLYRAPAPLAVLKGRPLLLYTPELCEGLFHQVFSADCTLHHDWQDVVASLQQLVSGAATVGFFHQAAMQTANGLVALAAHP